MAAPENEAPEPQKADAEPPKRTGRAKAKPVEPVDAPTPEPVDDSNTQMGIFREAFEVASHKLDLKLDTRLDLVRKSVDKVQADLQAKLEDLRQEVIDSLRGANAVFEKWGKEIESLKATAAPAPFDPESIRAAIREHGTDVANDVLQGSLDEVHRDIAGLRTDVEMTQRELALIHSRETGPSVPVSGPATQPVIRRVFEGPWIDAPTLNMPAPRGVQAKVLELMRLVDEIGKGREASTGRGGEVSYMFRGVDDAMNAVGSAMRKVGLIMTTTVVREEFDTFQTPKMWNGKNEGVTLVSVSRVLMRYTFVDPDDGSEHPLEMWGTARDNGDKDTSKSVSAAMKYALFQGLNIPVKGMQLDQTGTGTDPENDNPTVQAAEVVQAQRPQPISPPPAADDPWASVPPLDSTAGQADRAQHDQAQPEPPAQADQAVPASPAPEPARPAAPASPAAPGPKVELGASPENAEHNEKLTAAVRAYQAALQAKSVADINAILGHARKLGVTTTPVSVNGKVQSLQAHLVPMVGVLQQAAKL